MNYKKLMMAILAMIIVLALVLIAFLVSYFGIIKVPNNKEYTWEEFEAMTLEEQAEFQKSFKKTKDFDKWLAKAQKNAILPWENGGKAPSEYTWEEYETLTDFLQDAFFESFENVEEFDKWMNKATGNSPEWMIEGKVPSEYTWEEFEALDDEQQAEFQKSFRDPKDFENWIEKAQENAILPWKNGGKKTDEYTWEEFEALTDLQKDAFFESFASIDEFDKWLQANEPK